MKEIKVLLCCGAGFSSGFLAQKARQVAKKRNLNLSIEARSESVVGEYISQIDLLLIGPHLENALENLRDMCRPYNVPAEMIPAATYSGLDGNALVDQILNITGGNENAE